MPNTHSIDLEDTSSQYLSVADTAPLSITGNLTIEFWVKPETVPGTMTIVSKTLSTGNQRSYYVQLNGSGHIVVGISSTGSSPTENSFTTSLAAGTWYHIAVVYTAASGTVEVFKNGVSAGSNATYPTSIFDSTASFIIGSESNGAFNHFDGKIDEVRVWNTTKNAAAILASYQTELVGNETNLVGYWKLNNALTDSTANAATLTNNNSATFSTDTPFSTVALWKLPLLGIG